MTIRTDAAKGQIKCLFRFIGLLSLSLLCQCGRIRPDAYPYPSAGPCLRSVAFEQRIKQKSQKSEREESCCNRNCRHMRTSLSIQSPADTGTILIPKFTDPFQVVKQGAESLVHVEGDSVEF